MAAKETNVAVKIKRDKSGKYYIDEPIQAAALRKLEAAYEVGKPRLTLITIPMVEAKKEVKKETKTNDKSANTGGKTSKGNKAAGGKRGVNPSGDNAQATSANQPS